MGYLLIAIVFNCTEAAFFRMMTPVWIFFLLSITSFPEPEVAMVPKRPRRTLFSGHGEYSEETTALSGQVG